MNRKVFDIGDRKALAPGELGEHNAPEDDAKVQRTPWNGSLAAAELDMPGGLLLAALTACANTRGHHFTQMAAELGVTYGYIAQLRNGNRGVAQISDDFALACARYLVVPRMTVLMLAARITPEDMFESNEMMASEVIRAFEYVCTDPLWGPLVTPEMRAGTLETQYGVVRLYEKAAEKSLMPKALDMSTLAEEVVKLAKLQATRKETVSTASGARKRGPRVEATVITA
jgi:hypothetical protein